MLKRLFDILLAFLGIILFFPLAILIAILIKLDDGGYVIFGQDRWGRGGKRFRAYKFRSMKPLPSGKLQDVKDTKSRITRIGTFLRASAMDELPQLINILKGDMSFVGPRALSVEEIGPETKDFQVRHEVRPGLTGLAQVCAAKNATLEEKFAFDILYVKKRAFFLDLKLIMLSVGLSLTGSWETPRRFALNLTDAL
jgi:lipopolysaccharide/colanic/teichoic acid biosynthesis glycosyltransferase